MEQTPCKRCKTTKWTGLLRNELCGMCYDQQIPDLQAENAKLKQILASYKIQYTAAMRATSLGLCKKAISHALADEKKIRQ